VVQTGERVVWMDVLQSYAELVAADPNRLVPIPDGISSEAATAALMHGMTAHYLAHDSYPIRSGDWVVVHAAAGGVGLLLTQMAKLLGGRVIGTTSSDEKAGLARDAGADEILGYEGFAQRAKEIAGGEGVAAVYDGVGKTTFYEGLKAIRPMGRMIVYGASSGQPDPLPVALLAGAGSLYVQRPTIGTYTRTPQLLRDRARAVFELLAQGKLRVRIGARYPLAQARQAHIDLEARKTTGKILLLP
jgi:NADPH:quinone reductase